MKLDENWWQMSVNEPNSLSDALFQHLYRIFTLFADRTSQATVKPNQAEFLIDELLRELRRPTTPKISDLPDDVTFNEFLNLLQVLFPEREELQISTDRIFERYVNHIIGKGFVFFRRCNIYSKKTGCFGRKSSRKPDKWRNGWCTILPGMVKIKFEGSEKEVIIPVDEETAIEPASNDNEKIQWKLVIGSDQIFQFAHLDPIAAQLLIKDIRTARDYNTREALADFDQKRSLRTRSNKDTSSISAKTQKTLETERIRLESELEEERKNRKDEEIVRGLTTRLLKQEMEKSEQMQQVIYELRSKLVHDEQPEQQNEEEIEKDDDDLEVLDAEQISEICENEETEITLPSREEQLQQYAYHFYTIHADQHVTSADEEIWKQNYNLIVSTQSV